jgi:hypothetical protein
LVPHSIRIWTWFLCLFLIPPHDSTWSQEVIRASVHAKFLVPREGVKKDMENINYLLINLPEADNVGRWVVKNTGRIFCKNTEVFPHCLSLKTLCTCQKLY